MRNPAAKFAGNSPIRLTNNGLAYVFKEPRLATTSGSALEHNEFVGQISTIMRVLSRKDGDLSSQFDNINEKDGANGAATSDNIRSTSLYKMFIVDHTEANWGNIRGQILLEDIFGFCNTFKKVPKKLGFHLIFRTANLQDICYATIADATQIDVTNNSLYLYVPFLIPSTGTQVMFNESVQNNYRIYFDEWYTERRIVTDQIYHVDIGSAQSVNSPKFLICAHQSEARSGVPNKRKNISIFDHLDVREFFVEIDSVRYPRDNILTGYAENEYIDQYRDLKRFYREYVREELLSPFISYTDLKSKYPIQIIDLRFQVDHITPNFNCLKITETLLLMVDYLSYYLDEKRYK